MTALDGNFLVYNLRALRDIWFDERLNKAGQFSDLDLCFRLAKNGWKFLIDPRIKVLHTRKVTSGRPWSRNHLYFHLKHPTSIITQYRKQK
jgi:GT2 family glycosyltransferase